MKTRPEITTKTLGVVCLALLCGLLTAGLWPFHAPLNQIAWLPGGGLLFGDHATLIRSSAFALKNTEAPTPCSLEIWLQPSDLVGISGTLLAFDNPTGTGFSLHHSNADLVLQRGRTRFFMDNVFLPDEPVFITITALLGQTNISVAGKLIRTFTDFPLSAQDFRGQLVVGNSPIENSSFEGQLRGLALYASALPSVQVKSHYQTWTHTGRPVLTTDDAPAALYLFNEGRGQIVHNAVTPGLDLAIPAHFVVLHEKVLERPWTEFHANRGYYKDILINVGGFVPFGLFVQAFRVSRNKGNRRLLLTVIAGFSISLTIEVLQSFLPTRFSGITDLFTNTLGTWIGAVWYAPLMRYVLNCNSI